MTYDYLKLGRMSQRPYHLIGADGTTSVCGRVKAGDEGVQAVAMAPEPVGDWLLCEVCRQRAAVAAVQRVAATSPFHE